MLVFILFIKVAKYMQMFDYFHSSFNGIFFVFNIQFGIFTAIMGATLFAFAISFLISVLEALCHQTKSQSLPHSCAAALPAKRARSRVSVMASVAVMFFIREVSQRSFEALLILVKQGCLQSVQPYLDANEDMVRDAAELVS